MNKSFLIALFSPYLFTIAMAETGSGLIEVKAARPSYEGLKIKSSLVPTFEIYRKKQIQGKMETFKVKNIPVLDIGEERQLQAAPLPPLVLSFMPSLKLPKIKSKPKVEDLKFTIPAYDMKTSGPTEVTSPDAISKIPDLILLNYIADPGLQETKPNIVKLDEMNPNDYKMLQALIFLELQKNYPLAMGLLAELMEEPNYRLQALYQYAMTAKGLNLNSEFRQYMIQVAKEANNKMWQQKATEALVENVSILEKTDIPLIDPLILKYDLDVSNNDSYQIVRAKYYSELGNLGLVEEALNMISENSTHYFESLILRSLLDYRQGHIEEAIISLENLIEKTESQKSSPFRTLGALTLARMQFQKNLYKEAFQSYLKVDKGSPLWLQAMIESSWTQILAEDYEGAAGNMFSLHTDFFKKAFAPESYLVRTVGYLNLCQYGDGAQVLNEMHRRYAPWKNKLNQYETSHKTAINYYDTVKTWLKNSDLNEVDGLPRSFIVELARHPSFLNFQKQINNYEDEINAFNKLSISLVKIERDLLLKKNELLKEIQLAKTSVAKETSTAAASKITDKDSFKEKEHTLLAYSIQYHIANKARNSIRKLRLQALNRIEKEKDVLRQTAGTNLQKHFSEMVASLNKVLDQNDVLHYELYSGAGEHIRYQMAGGEINIKEHPELKVQQEKSLNWKFKGEFWEDEVGHYRSSLKNVCQQ